MEKSILKVVNIKCGGCEASIISALEKAGLKNISVNVAAQEVSFEGEKETAAKILSGLGYPLEGSSQAKSLIKKAKSYASCMIGRLKK